MIKVHEEIYLRLVRNSLWDKHVEVPSDFKDWSLIMYLAESQAMQGTIANALLGCPFVLQKMNTEFQGKMRNVLRSNVIMHSIANSTLQELVMALRKADVECVLLKGQGLAVNYPNPELRECGDIDLYVGTENYHRSYDVLKETVDEIDDISALKKGGKHYHAKLNNISIEVHKYSEVMSSVSLDKLYQGYAFDGLSKNLVELEIGETVVLTPADNYNAFYVFNHFWNHFISVGIGLRQLCDWTMFLHARGANVDKQYLHKILTDMKLMKAWKTFGCIAVDFIGLPQNEFPFYDPKYREKSRGVLKHVLNEGDLGRETEFIRVPNKGYLHEKVFSLKFYLKRFMSMLKLFPQYAFKQLNHSILNGIRLLFKDFVVYLPFEKTRNIL